MRLSALRTLHATVGALSILWYAVVHAQPAPLALRGVTVVDVTDGSLLPDQTVLVEDRRITAVGSIAEVEVPGDAEVIEAAGGYLIPGLWDLHVHSAASADWHFPLLLAYGITGVRNMHSTVDTALALTASLKRDLARGERLGPRFLANGPIIDGEPPVWPGTVVVRTAAQARAAVDSLADGGADFIKVYDSLSREAYFAVADRANERGLPVDGHLPVQVRPEEAAAAGQRTVEHTSGITMGCSSRADSLRAEHARLMEVMPTLSPVEGITAFFQLVRAAFDTRDRAACEAVIEVYREHGVAVVPTAAGNLSGLSPSEILGDSTRMQGVPASVRDGWAAMAAGPDDPVRVLLDPVRPIFVENVRMLYEAGVPILAGTDVGNPFLIPGYSLHDELAQLVEAGLTPLDALRAATLNPARVLGTIDSLGTIEPGKLADLVLLEADPLEDIRNTRRIAVVVLGGRVFRREALDAFLAGRAPEGAH